MFEVLIVAAILLAIVVMVSRMSAKRDAERREVWRSFAKKRGLGFRLTEGGLFTPGSMRIEGTSDDVRLSVSTYTRQSRSDDTQTTYTQVHAVAPFPLELEASVYAEHLFSGIGKALGFQDVSVGDRAFDDVFVVKADAEAAALELLTPEVRRALLKAGDMVRLEYKAGDVSVSWEGEEIDPGNLGRMVDLALLAASVAPG
ncbi:MAG: hypothetical protein HOV80_08940 [Polyangiaceae bacterium]|nr:hypothetical protein [Polyangiaceae bacterium]